MDDRIDFVVPWVDGSDKAWQAEKARYSCPETADARPERYRDWGILRYWFRGVEKFAPWVRKVHFITWGHLPPWLNVASVPPLFDCIGSGTFAYCFGKDEGEAGTASDQ